MMARDDYQMKLRLPEELRESVRTAADANSRSMNAEIALRLEQSFSEWPRISLPEHMIERARTVSEEERRDYEVLLQSYAQQLFRRRFPDLDEYIARIDDVFFEAIKEKKPDNEVNLRLEYLDFVEQFLRKLGIKRDNLSPHNIEDQEELDKRARGSK